MSGLTYDTGALIAAEANDRLLWSLHSAALTHGIAPTVPAGVLGEVWRGGLDDTVDLAVTEGALRRGDAVVTSNRRDIELAAGGQRVVIHDV